LKHGLPSRLVAFFPFPWRANMVAKMEGMLHSKVFGIGFHKTGTTSLKAALEILGYRVTGPNFVEDEDLAESVLAKALAVAPQFDAFQDNPWPILYPEMDQAFPGSKFILTIRDEAKWYASALRQFGARTTPMRRFIYGTGSPLGNEASYCARYRSHNEAVLQYFASRPKDLLLVDITRGDGWELLCPFLGCETPSRPFPYKNAGKDKRPLARIGRFLNRRAG
jgi:hypothetical protein